MLDAAHFGSRGPRAPFRQLDTGVRIGIAAVALALVVRGVELTRHARL